MLRCIYWQSKTVAANTRIVGSKPAHGTDVSFYVVLSCVGAALVTDRRPPPPPMSPTNVKKNVRKWGRKILQEGQGPQWNVTPVLLW
jgi:hypothetical protein